MATKELVQECKTCEIVYSHTDIGNTLLDRLVRPLTSDPKFQSMNESTKRSVSFLRGKLEVLQRSCSEVDTALPQQVS